MKSYGKYVYIGLPVLGVLFYLLYLHTAAIDMVYSDYIRLINSYLPDVWNPEKFFVPDLLTRIPANYLERGINVQFFGYSVTFDRVMGVLGFGLSALCIGAYSRQKRIGLGWYAALMAVMFSLNKWEMLYNGTGWVHFWAFACFYYNYLVLDRVYDAKFKRTLKRGDMVKLFVLPAFTTICVAGPYCAIYSMTLILALLFLYARNRLIIWQDCRRLGIQKKDGPTAVFDSRLCRLTGTQIALLLAAVVLPLLLYLWSNSLAVYEYAGAVEAPLLESFLKEPIFFLKFFLKSFASTVFGVELIDRHMAGVPGKVWCLLGLLVIGAHFLALWLNFYYGIVEETILPLMLLAGGAMNHLLVLVSRWIFMPNDSYGMSSRYALQYQVGIIGILLTFGLAARSLRERSAVEGAGGQTGSARRPGTVVRTVMIAVTTAFVLGNLVTSAEEFSFGKYRKEHNLEVKEILLNFENETDDTLKQALEYSKPGKREALAILKEHGWNIFGEEP